MSISTLRTKINQRNQLLSQTRHFFAERGVLEVDTSLMREFTVTDPYMSAFSVVSATGKRQGYLQTSPEYAMKKLLSDGSGDIFQLSKMFRAEENSNIHLSEFTLLEWYRLGFDHNQLIQEVCEFLKHIVGHREVAILDYKDCFLNLLSFDPHSISLDKLTDKTRSLLGELPNNLLRDNYLTLLFSEKIEPSFDLNSITVVTNYPASQASLAKTRVVDGVETADRFEVYLNGIELANGFNELTDAKQQLTRFKMDIKIRQQLGYPKIEIDQNFIQCLEKGLPDCAGVALGFDRLLMIKLSESNIEKVVI
ncbi:MAG: EF-P lysine aminoacylase GenX [Kangiellaceae bacterium]|nr:EF-P lysine aminoacylase GenX [Kangiellaceae bacterium]